MKNEKWPENFRSSEKDNFLVKFDVMTISQFYIHKKYKIIEMILKFVTFDLFQTNPFQVRIRARRLFQGSWRSERKEFQDERRAGKEGRGEHRLVGSAQTKRSGFGTTWTSNLKTYVRHEPDKRFYSDGRKVTSKAAKHVSLLKLRMVYFSGLFYIESIK